MYGHLVYHYWARFDYHPRNLCNSHVRQTYTFNNSATYEKEVFPADTDGKTCGREHPGYNYLYFASPSQLVLF